MARTLIAYGGIWANLRPEVLYYRAGTDGHGARLTGDESDTLTFPKDQLPESFASYLWSVIVVDTTHFRDLPNPRNRSCSIARRARTTTGTVR